MKRLLVCVSICFLAVCTMGLNTQNGRAILGTSPIDERFGEQRFFVTIAATGIGDCLSWATACTFRNVLPKLSPIKDDVIYVGAGDHDLNNGSDATGTTISDNYFHIIGVGNSIGGAARLVNSANPATHILRVTGVGGIVENVIFGNTGQPDPNVIMLNIREDFNTVEHCTFTQEPADGGGTAVLIDNSATRVNVMTSEFYNILDAAIKTDGTSMTVISDNTLLKGGKGIYITNAADTDIYIRSLHITGMTTGIEISNGATTGTHFADIYFQDNVSDVTDSGAYAGSHWSAISTTLQTTEIYPAGAGVAITKDKAAWTWGDAAVEIIPASTIPRAFKITGMNVQTWSSEQTFKLQLLHGQVTPSELLGVYELTVGDPTPASRRPTTVNPMFKDIYVPANAAVGAKIMTSTAGSDSITITLSYEQL
jgi:hypothetical protein